jgi:predicted nucleic acid-binding protein
VTGEATELLGPTRIVLADANVLYSRVLRDYLVYAADQGAISIRWSRAILVEAVTHLQANNSRFDDEQGELLIRLLNDAYPQAEVEPTASARRKVKRLDMPDEDDRHVLAAAVTAHADILCTDNVKDFPSETMVSVGIESLTTDALLSWLVTMYPSKMLEAHRRAVASLTGATDRSTIAALRRAKATKTADLMEALLKRS